MSNELGAERAGFAPRFESVSKARHFVRRVLAAWGLEDMAEPASLLVSELATNSLLHAKTEFEVTVAFDGASLRLGVSDGSPTAPTVKSHSRQATTGRGLSLITGVADSWGVEPRPGGKTVWCVLVPRAAGMGGTVDPEAGATLDETTSRIVGEVQAPRDRRGRARGSGDQRGEHLGPWRKVA